MDQNNSHISLNDLFEVSLPGFAADVENLLLVVCSKKETFEYQYAFVTNNSPETKWLFPEPGKESIYIFPLYIHHENSMNQMDKINAPKTSNLNPEIVKQIAQKLFLHFDNEKEYTNQNNNSPVCYANSAEVSEDFKIDAFPQSFAPINIFDYVYAVLNSGKYTQKNKDQLKKDFPIIPLPKNQIIFWKLITLGKELRKLHSLEGSEVEKYITQFPVEGKNKVNKIRFEENYAHIDGDTIIQMTPSYERGRVYINDTQFFQMVPRPAWELTLGTLKPAKQWLKNKKDSILSAEEIMQYQKIIVALFETDRIRKEIDKLSF
ncbi:MAG: type ISP restriction/modification enzyme [Ginsengibacter sp.]